MWLLDDKETDMCINYDVDTNLFLPVCFLSLSPSTTNTIFFIPATFITQELLSANVYTWQTCTEDWCAELVFAGYHWLLLHLSVHSLWAWVVCSHRDFQPCSDNVLCDSSFCMVFPSAHDSIACTSHFLFSHFHLSRESKGRCWFCGGKQFLGRGF